MTATDGDLVVRALGGSESAFRELVRRYQRPLYGVVSRIVSDRGVAEELVQDTFVKAFMALDTYDRQRKFSTWLFRIGHNVTVDYVRRRRIETVSLDDPAEGGEPREATVTRTPSPDRLAEHAELAAALEAALAEIRVDYRELVILRYQEGLTYEEIASVTDQTAGTVKSSLHRARKELARRLTAAGWTDAS